MLWSFSHFQCTVIMVSFLDSLVFYFLCPLVPAQVMDAVNRSAVPGQLLTPNSCKTCTKIFDLVKDLLSDAEVQGTAKSDMNGVCEALLSPGPVKLCKQIVDKHLPMGFAIADTSIKPGHVCSVIGFCVDAEGERPRLMAQLQTAFKPPYFGDTFGAQCLICTHFIETVKGLLPKDELEDVLNLVLGQGCNLLPNTLKVECEKSINLATKTVIELVMSFISPDTICSLLLLCTDSSVELPITEAAWI
ncbi:prosaposin-like [Clupea harengus]|uniref:Prosaposin-like n=1 Tax=Clupea harengus TaxID=7950 RepID=A0A6P8GSF4_CLUHA|nr:prosaposin-like [Clupea harengus]